MVDDLPSPESQTAMFNEWKATGDPNIQEYLLSSFDPLITSYIKKYSQSPIEYDVLKAKAFSLARNALPNYDPNAGARLGTYLYSQLAPLHRFVMSHQNPTYLPEHLSQRFGVVEKAVSDLREQLGRDPTSQEVSDQTGDKLTDIERIRFAMRPISLITALADESEVSGSMHRSINRMRDRRLAFLRAELKGKERRAFDYYMNMTIKRKKVSATDVATKIGVSVEDIYAWRRNWNKRLLG
jgi:DNA-directed RNA polymerase specialized sigma subunit